MGLFAKKKESAGLPPLAVLEYRTGDGRHWGFHYRLFREENATVLSYSRVMPEELQRIAAPEGTLEAAWEILERAHVRAWDGFDRCRQSRGRTKRWLLYLTFEDGTHLRAEGCGVYPKHHEEMENDLLSLLNGCIDIDPNIP